MNKLFERVKAVLLSPKPTWEAIKAEPSTVAQVYREYLIPLAAVPAVAAFIGHSLIGMQMGLFGSYRVPIVTGLVSAVLTYTLTLAGVLVAAKVINALAPTFGATQHNMNAFKVAAYTMTPALVAGVLNILPAFAPLVMLAGLYGIYLLYLGLQSMMACPPEKAVGYTVVSILVLAAIYFVIGVIVAVVVGTGMSIHGMGFARHGGGDVTFTANIDGHDIRAKSSGDQFTMETAEGKTTVSKGGSAQIPDGFPKDVYIYAGATVQTAVTTPAGWNLMLLTKDGPDKVCETLKAQMTANGWKEVMSQAEAGGQAMLTYQKQGQTAALVVSPSAKATEINVAVVKDKTATGSGN